mmetsp:Transcript_155547/g.274686  ORF Transcript_155547/g.274686 Transcript_155547/m.274686 type:complete len:404 (-) Transcript_155547:70-1281(-)
MTSSVLKVFHGEDVRRIRVDMPTDDQQCFEAVQAAVVKAFGLKSDGESPASVALMCKDEDVLCELTPITLRKLLNEENNGCMRLYICETGCAETSPVDSAPISSTADNCATEESEATNGASLRSNASDEMHQDASSQSPFVSLGALLTTDMEKKPDHVGEGILQGLHHMGHHVSDGLDTFKTKSHVGHLQEGTIGEIKGAGEGLLSVGLGVWKGWFDFQASTYHGLRRTPDMIADQVNKDRLHNKHGVQDEGKGELLETNLDEEEPQNVMHGFRRGVTGFTRGVSSGFKALVKRPQEAYKQKGLEGLPMGLGQGILGLGTNVAAGTLDYTTNMSLGWKNTPEAVVRAFKAERAMPHTPPNTPAAAQDNAQHTAAESQHTAAEFAEDDTDFESVSSTVESFVLE